MYEIIQFFFKKPKKTQKNPILVGFFKWVFLGFFGWVFLGGYFVCPPCLEERVLKKIDKSLCFKIVFVTNDRYFKEG